MDELKSQFETIYIHHEAVIDDVAQRFMQLFPPTQIQFVSETPFPESQGALSAQEFERSKRNIYIKRFEGSFFKQCPGAKPGLVCCNYFVLNLGLQCNMNCSYCYLQSYLNTPVMTIYSNIERALEELRTLASAHPDKPYRVGTGETIDSLSLDPLTHYSHQLIDFFHEFPHWTLELKTKSAAIDHFVHRPHAGNVLVSWSLNPQNIISAEEHGTANLDERLGAALRCVDKGFKVAFHCDPMVWHPNWQNSYGELVDHITKQFTPEQVAHISLGTLRFQPEQRHIMRERFGMGSLITSAEMFRSHDGKMRYDGRLRQEMFDFVLQRFRQHSRHWRVALCMETPETWVTTMDGSPRRNQHVAELFRPLPKPSRPRLEPPHLPH